MLKSLLKALLLIYCLFGAVPFCSAGSSPSTLHVLILNSYHQGFKWSDDIVAGIRQPLLASFEKINIHIEHMDTKRFPHQNLDLLANIYAQKYQHLPLDVIITADDNAFNFIKGYRSQVFGPVPLVFCGVNYLTNENLAGLENYTGVNEDADIKGTLDVIRSLHPEANRIVAITDLTTSGSINRQKINSLEPFYFTKVDVDHWYDLSLAELLEQLGQLSAGDIVLFNSFFRDRQGQVFEFDAIATEISAASPVPVYASWDYNLGYGVVGGKLTSGYSQGRTAGEYAVRIINGEAASAIPVQWESPNRYMFDETFLKRFGIDQNKLPADAVVINHIPSLFEKHRNVILSFTAAMIPLLAVVVFLVFNTQKRLRAEKLLQLSESRYRDLTEWLPQTVFEIDETGLFSYVNRFGLSWSGYSQADIEAGYPAIDLFHPEDQPRVSENIVRIRAGGGLQGNEYRVRKKDGTMVPVLSYTRKCEIRPGTVGLRGILIDISNIHRAEKEALVIRLYLKNVVDLMPTILIGTDADGGVTLWNIAAANATGISEDDAHGNFLADLIPSLALEQKRVGQAIAEQRTFSEKRVRRKLSGEERYWDILVYPLSLHGINSAIVHIEDTTEQIKVERVMVQTEKMITVGGLAAGMAHEINNPLAAIMQNAQVIGRRINAALPKNIAAAQQCDVPLEKVTRYLEQRQIPAMLKAIHESGTRAVDIIQDMLNFSRIEGAEMRACDIHKLIELALGFAATNRQRYNFSAIELRKEYGDLPPVICSATQIQQVLLNIIQNAAEAMVSGPQKNVPHQLSIRTHLEGDHVCIVIEDNGPGMSEGVSRRIFEPFFTTKDLGVGTGLGLSISYFIVTQNHKGTIDVVSVPSRGTKFIIELPLNPAGGTA